MATGTLPTRQSQSNIWDMISTLSPIFLGTGGSTSTQTQSPRLTQEGMDAALQKILQSTQGLAAVSQGQRSAGLYNSSTNQQLVNDLISRASAEVAMAGTPQTTTTVNSGTAPLIDPMMAAGGLLLAQAFSKDGLGGIFGSGGATNPAASGPTGQGPLSGVGTQVADGVGNVWDRIQGALGNVNTSAVDMGVFANPSALVVPGVTGATTAADLSSMLGFDANTMQRWAEVGAGGVDAAGTTAGADSLDLGSLPLGTMLNLAQGNMQGVASGLVMNGLGSAMAAATGIPIVGPAIGLLGGLFGNKSVVCTELNKHGYMSDELYESDTAYAQHYLNKKVIRGYHWWAISFVQWMRKHPWSRKYVAPFAVARARHIARDYNLLGFLVRVIGEPVCWIIGNFVKDKDCTVLYAPKVGTKPYPEDLMGV